MAVIRATESDIGDVYAWGNSTHGIDFEPNQASSAIKDVNLYNPHTWSNGESGIALYNGTASQDTDTVRNVSVRGPRSHNNTENGILLFGFRHTTVTDGRIYANELHGVRVDNYDYGLKIVDNAITANAGDGVSFLGSSRPAVLVQGNLLAGNAGYGIKNVVASNFWLRLAHNDILGNLSGQVSLTPPTTNGFIRRYGNHVAASENPSGPEDTVSSAATITLPESNDMVVVAGTTTITSVTASYTGRRVTLIFSGALTFTDGSNLRLAGNFVTTGDDTITLVCDGTNWYETGRSIN